MFLHFVLEVLFHSPLVQCIQRQVHFSLYVIFFSMYMTNTHQGSPTLFFCLLYFLSSCHFFSLPYHYYSCAETSVSPRRSHKYPPLVPLGTNMSRQFILHWVKKGIPVRERVPVLLLVCFSVQHKHLQPQPVFQCSGSSCILSAF